MPKIVVKPAADSKIDLEKSRSVLIGNKYGGDTIGRTGDIGSIKQFTAKKEGTGQLTVTSDELFLDLTGADVAADAGKFIHYFQKLQTAKTFTAAPIQVVFNGADATPNLMKLRQLKSSYELEEELVFDASVEIEQRTKIKKDGEVLAEVLKHTDGRVIIQPAAGNFDFDKFTALVKTTQALYSPAKDPKLNSIAGAVSTPTLSITAENRSFKPSQHVASIKIDETTQAQSADGKSVEIKNKDNKVLITVDETKINATIDGDAAEKTAKVDAFVSTAKQFLDKHDVIAYEMDCPDEKMLLEATKKMLAQNIPVKITHADREQRILNALTGPEKTAYSTNINNAEKMLHPAPG